MNERLNIRRMDVPQRDEKTSTFDARVDLAPDGLQKIIGEYEIHWMHSRWDFAVELAEKVRLLAPEQEIIVTPERTTYVKEKLKEAWKGDMYGYAQRASKARTAFPETTRDIAEDDWERMRRDVERFRNPVYPNIATHIAYAYYTKILFPDKPVQFTPAEEKRLDDYIDTCRAARPGDLASQLAKRRVLFPEKHDTTKASDWALLRKELLNADLDVTLLARFAANMQILAAENVRILKNGIELSMSVKEVEDERLRAPLPEALHL